MSLIRVVQVEGEVPIKVGQVYQLDLNKRQIDSSSTDPATSVAESVFIEEKNVADDDNNDAELSDRVLATITETRLVDALVVTEIAEQPVTQTGKFRKKAKKVNSLKNVLRTNLGFTYGPSLVDHAISFARLDSGRTDLTLTPDEFEKLLGGFQNCDDIIKNISLKPSKGYIIAKKLESSLAYDEFHPFKPAYFDNEKEELLSFDSFAICLDEFFAKLESQRLEQKAKQAENHAMKKLQSVKDSAENLIKKYFDLYINM